MKKELINLSAIIETSFSEHQELLPLTKAAVAEPLKDLLDICLKSLGQGNKLILFGNGGSASDAQHIAAELVGRFVHNRSPLAAISLNTDTSALTAIANDYGYDRIFERQIQGVGTAGDVAIGISTSGNSPNVNNGLAAARLMNISATGLTGNTGGLMSKIADPLLIVPSNVTARIQEMHILIGHILCGAIENNLGCN